LPVPLTVTFLSPFAVQHCRWRSLMCSGFFLLALVALQFSCVYSL
jgi:hypothetical protein